ncbi:MAG: hypothetical protein QGH42_06325 [Kiritimatiellia bacterium]|jgi:hypothetical protein|nr:hypothetical protein [Kiritimatiellia bacterium]MDP6809483.1 hypothetical protein [Kiritimatiellia bacterium]MDP7023840.1 hypothetical protein [Kiritimatiellia bacterium]
MFNNPLIERFRYSLMRPRQFGIYVGIYATIAVLMLLITLAAYSESAGVDLDGMCQSLFAQFTTLQILVLWIWTSINVASAIRDERRDKSYDFFKLLPLPPWKKTVGIVIGKNLVAYLLGAITFFLIVVSALFARVPVGVLVELIFLILSISIAMNLLALLASVAQRVSENQRTTSPIVVVFLGFMLIGPFISIVASLMDTDGLADFTIPFMAWETRGLVLISAIALYLSVWVFKGICRQFRVEEAPMFTARGAAGFMLGGLLILLGLCSPHFRDNHAEEVCITFWGLSLGLSILTGAGSFLPFNSTIEELAAQPAQRPGLLRFTLMQSNLRVVFVLLALALVTGLPCGLVCGISLAHAVVWLITLTLFALFYVLLFELVQVYRPVSPKIHILIAFIGLLYAILPLILAGVFDSSDFAICSPLGYFGVLYDSTERSSNMMNWTWALNLILCTLAYSAISRRYKKALLT